jgi:CRP-like cAMP-binding protein
VESELERQLSRIVMADAKVLPRHNLTKGETLIEQDEPGTNMFLILDGMLDVEVDGDIVAEVGPGAIVGERASIEGGMRTSTLRAATNVRAVAIPASALDTGEIVALASAHRREMS